MDLRRIVAIVVTVVTGAGLSLGVAACGSSSPSGSPPTSTLKTPSDGQAASTTTTRPPGTAATTPATITPTTVATTTTLAPACATDGLAVTAAATDAGAGSLSYVIQFKDIGTTSCRLAGFPGVSFAGSSGNQVTPGAARTAQGYQPVTLQPGQVASAVLRVAQALNYPTATCVPVTATQLRVIPPNQTSAALVAVPSQKACSGTARQTQIGPIVAGVATG